VGSNFILSGPIEAKAPRLFAIVKQLHQTEATVEFPIHRCDLRYFPLAGTVSLQVHQDIDGLCYLLPDRHSRKAYAGR
jgi:hypothetical protein